MDGQQIEIRTDYPYVNIRKALFRDSSLRPQTKYVLILMLSLPPDWDYSIRGMAKIAQVSKDTMAKMVKELEAAGYLLRKQTHSASGRFDRCEYILSDTPVLGSEEGEPCPNLPDTVSPDTENSPQLNNKQPITKESNTPYSPPEGDKPPRKQNKRREPKTAPDWKPERFEGFWKLYPLKKSKQAAIRAWDRLRPDNDLIATMGRALQRQLASEDWQRGFGIPYPATWLNGRRWEDEIPDKPPPDGPAPGTVVEREEVPVW